MRPVTPYSQDLGDREPVAALRGAAERIRTLTAGWPPSQFESSYAPGKWSARLILAHLTHAELAFGHRARMALTVPSYVAQSFDQDRWLAREPGINAPDALNAFSVLNQLNVGLFASLSEADRATPLSHPEYGAQTVDWIIHCQAGHLLHHLAQIEQIAGQAAGARA